jgi:hypoxanthine phosphoribosyltransferase
VTSAYARLATALQPQVDAGNGLLLGVLLGGLVTLAHVAERLAGDFLIDVCRVSRYGDATRGGMPDWVVPPRADLRGRRVIIVDDIFDEGFTLEFVAARCRSLGAASVQSAVLVRKRHTRNLAGVTPDYAGIEVGDEYVFGCGMDYQGRWRHLAEIYGLPG